jgi:hypothetical protein
VRASDARCESDYLWRHLRTLVDHRSKCLTRRRQPLTFSPRPAAPGQLRLGSPVRSRLGQPLRLGGAAAPDRLRHGDRPRRAAIAGLSGQPEGLGGTQGHGDRAGRVRRSSELAAAGRDAVRVRRRAADQFLGRHRPFEELATPPAELGGVCFGDSGSPQLVPRDADHRLHYHRGATATATRTTTTTDSTHLARGSSSDSSWSYPRECLKLTEGCARSR